MGKMPVMTKAPDIPSTLLAGGVAMPMVGFVTWRLRGLGTDYVDLWLVHWPPAPRALTQMWREFLNLRGAGMTRAVGVSNFSLAQIDTLVSKCAEGPAVNQIPWSPARYD